MDKDLISTCQESRPSQIAVNIFNPTFLFLFTVFSVQRQALEIIFDINLPPPFYNLFTHFICILPMEGPLE